jgi:MYXO-CTERM domain-containing protein
VADAKPLYMTKQNRKLCAYAAMAIALSLSPLAAYGQTSSSPATNATSSQTTVADDRGDRPQHHNYGWIGLLGLLGLTGLMRKRQDTTYVDHSDRDTRRSMAGARS